MKREKIFLITGMLLLGFFSGVLIYNKISTGEFLYKDITLKGGQVILIPPKYNPVYLETLLEKKFKEDFTVRKITDISGKPLYLSIETSEKINADEILKFLNISKNEASVSKFSTMFGKSFYNQLLIALAIAFTVISLTIYIRIRHFLASLGVLLSLVFDIICTLGFLTLIKYKIGAAGLGALLMVMGYAIDNNILLATYWLKEKDFKPAFKIGLTMWGTTILALISIYIFVTSDIVKQIAFVLLIAEMFDVFAFLCLNPSIYKIFDKK